MGMVVEYIIVMLKNTWNYRIDGYIKNFCEYLTINNIDEYIFADEFEDYINFQNRQNNYFIHLNSNGRYRHELMIIIKKTYLVIDIILYKTNNRNRKKWDYNYISCTITDKDGVIKEEF